MTLALGSLALAVWAYLLLGRGGFWRARERDGAAPRSAPPSGWPAVTAVIPARDEADVVGAAVASLLRQDYGGALDVVLVDDQSTDGTAEAARLAARECGAEQRLAVIFRPAGPASSGRCTRESSRRSRGPCLRLSCS